MSSLAAAGVSERYASQLAGPTTVFKVESPFYNYYSRFFQPYKHFIPVKYDLSDLVDQVRTFPSLCRRGLGQGSVARPQVHSC